MGLGIASCVAREECTADNKRYWYDDGTLSACLAISCVEMFGYCKGGDVCGFTKLAITDDATHLCVASCGPDRYLHNGVCLNNCTDTTTDEYTLREDGEKVCDRCSGARYKIFDVNIGQSGKYVYQCVDCKLYDNNGICTSTPCSAVSRFRSEASAPVKCFDSCDHTGKFVKNLAEPTCVSDCGDSYAYETTIFKKNVYLCVDNCPEDAPFTYKTNCVDKCTTTYITDANNCVDTCKYWYVDSYNGNPIKRCTDRCNNN